jgi:hypothetical protein
VVSVGDLDQNPMRTGRKVLDDDRNAAGIRPIPGQVINGDMEVSDTRRDRKRRSPEHGHDSDVLGPDKAVDRRAHRGSSQIECGNIATGESLLVCRLRFHRGCAALLLLLLRDGQRTEPVIPSHLTFGLLRDGQFVVDSGLCIPEYDLERTGSMRNNTSPCFTA